MRSGAPLLAVVLIAACQDLLVLPAPPDTGAGAQLLLWMEENKVVRLDSADVAAGAPIIPGPFSRRSTAPQKPLSLVQLSFGCTLRELGLPAEQLALRDEPATAGVEVPSPRSTQVLDLASADPRWTAPMPPLDLSATLRRLPLENGTYCRNLGAEVGVGINTTPITVSGMTPSFEEIEVEWALHMGPGEGLVSLNAVRLSTRSAQFRLTLDGMTPTELSYRDGGRPTPLPRGRMTRAPDGSLWFVSQAGDVAHGSREHGLDVVGHLEWFGTHGSTTAAHVANVWVLNAGGAERLFVAYTQDAGGFFEDSEAAIFAYVPGSPPELVDAAEGFGYPSIAAASDGSVWIAGMELLKGHLHHGQRQSDGRWQLEEVAIPMREDDPRPMIALAPTHVEVLPDQRLRVIVAWVYLREIIGLRHLSVPMAAILEGPPDGLAWVSKSEGAGAITTDVLDLPDNLVVIASLDGNNMAALSLIQHEVRGCGGIRMLASPAYQERLEADNYDRLRAFVVPLDADSVAVLPSYSQVPAYVFRRPTRAPRCLLEPER